MLWYFVNFTTSTCPRNVKDSHSLLVSATSTKGLVEVEEWKRSFDSGLQLEFFKLIKFFKLRNRFIQLRSSKKLSVECCCSCLHAKLWTTLCDPRLLRRWDSPGMNTGVGCHFLLQINLFLIGGWLIYNTVFTSTMYQHESAIGIQTSPPSWTLPSSFHPSPLVYHWEPNLSSPSQTVNVTGHLILHVTVYMLQWYSLNSSHSLLPLPLCPQICSRSASSLLPANRFISTILLDSIYVS